jgi:hypothetical protein
VVLSGKRSGHHTASPYGVSIYEIAGSNLLSTTYRSLTSSKNTEKHPRLSSIQILLSCSMDMMDSKASIV